MGGARSLFPRGQELENYVHLILRADEQTDTDNPARWFQTELGKSNAGRALHSNSISAW
jgi:hypothetical protein